ncbi:hypothetical protein BHF68_05530 [Desulfuribacillus alkaliarsenatis]|uniref:NodB homology domain-containing protein n=1 Tax=Desulfuribacillus alkaliarsenatis TaxID=766136 RepID=A0A1E5G262_9FIRM|nr:hypothetical protein BHF68_05530 [Desulfuribacillus alkaliarsenatis]
MNGNNTEFGKFVYRRIIDEGHAIGNHTFDHSYIVNYSSLDSFIENFEALDILIYDTTGVKMDIFRFPGGSNNSVHKRYGPPTIMLDAIEYLKSRGYQYFDWNIDSGDARAVVVPKDEIVTSVISRIGDRSNINILFHDSWAKTTTPEALPEIIDYLIEGGYTFESLTKYSHYIHFEYVADYPNKKIH